MDGRPRVLWRGRGQEAVSPWALPEDAQAPTVGSPLGWAARLGRGARGLGGGWACIRTHDPWSPGCMFLP